MRSVGGASVWLLACVTGCWPMPPPDPGRPPPPPTLEPMPPPQTARPDSTGATAKAAPESEPEGDLAWDPSTRIIRCGDDTALPVPRDLAVYMPAAGDEITVAPPGSPPPGGLTAVAIDEIEGSFPIDRLEELEKRYAKRVTKLHQAVARLHAMTGGWTTDGEIHADVRTGKDGVTDAVVVADDARGAVWRLVMIHVEGCVFMTLELVRPDAPQRFAPMLERMCAAKPPRCLKDQPPISFRVP